MSPRFDPHPTAAAVLKPLAMAVALSAFFLTPSYAQPEQKNPGGTTLSRAEVVADLALWRRAGLDRYDVLARSYGVETESYRLAYEEYLRLRNSEEFQKEVQRARGD